MERVDLGSENVDWHRKLSRNPEFAAHSIRPKIENVAHQARARLLGRAYLLADAYFFGVTV